jgi:hypothetical protein
MNLGVMNFASMKAQADANAGVNAMTPAPSFTAPPSPSIESPTPAPPFPGMDI